MHADEDTPEWQRTWHGLFDILGCKWTFHVVRLLSIESQGFNEMERRLDGITSTMLSRRLKQLESEGIVCKQVRDTTPPTTSYRLTETGRELSRLLVEIEELNPAGGSEGDD